MTVAEEREELINRVLDGTVTKKQVQKEVDDLERKYGKEAFLASDFEKKEKPWDSDYYDKLGNRCLSGDDSKKLILHMVEVREYLQKQKRNKKIRIGIGVILMIIVLISIIVLIKNGHSGLSQEYSSRTNDHIQKEGLYINGNIGKH